jgi:hypothetical protein
MLQRQAELDGQPSVGDKYEADHPGLLAGATLHRTIGRAFTPI